MLNTLEQNNTTFKLMDDLQIQQHESERKEPLYQVHGRNPTYVEFIKSTICSKDKVSYGSKGLFSMISMQGKQYTFKYHYHYHYDYDKKNYFSLKNIDGTELKDIIYLYNEYKINWQNLLQIKNLLEFPSNIDAHGIQLLIQIIFKCVPTVSDSVIENLVKNIKSL